MNSGLLKELSALSSGLVDEPMAGHTSFRIGGPADMYVAAHDVAQLASLVVMASRHGVPYFILGAGTNILVSDRGIRGLVIENRARGVQRLTDSTLRADAGASLASLARRTARDGLEGLEWAIGIPGTLGGALRYNAGAYGGCMAQMVRHVEVMDASGERGSLSTDELRLGYRQSALEAGAVILGAELSLKPALAQELRSRLVRYRALRRRSQPWEPSAGSVFKNPLGQAAGWLIERAGLKGHRLGSAQVSPKHANFIVNLGRATASEVRGLMAVIQWRVYEAFGIELKLEIELVGEWL